MRHPLTKDTLVKACFGVMICLLSVKGFAQDFTITRYEMAGDNVVLFYNLTDTVKNRGYTINVYSSRDNFINPLIKLSGDVGLEVRPGINKKITWNAKEEYGKDFAGRVSLEVRGRIYVPFVRFAGFQDISSRKRGVPFTLTWTGGTRLNVLNFDLYKGDDLVWTQANVANTGNFEMRIPTSVKPGSDFRFRISDSKNKDEVVYTPVFKVKRKVPLMLKILPVAAIAVVAILVSQKSDGTDNTPQGPGEIPDAIKP